MTRYKTAKPTGIFRSRFEFRVASELEHSGVPYAYEDHEVRYVQPEAYRRYTPDFVLPNGIILEVKGLLTGDDRQKHLWIKDQFPDLDIRFVFMNPSNKIYKGSKTTYAKWATTNGFMYCRGPHIPDEWINEQPVKTPIAKKTKS